jgi:hypothetical protein
LNRIFEFKTEPERKRAKLENEGNSEEQKRIPSEPLVSGKMEVRRHGNGKLVLDMTYESGSMGKSAVVELSQYFKNRLNLKNPTETCTNAK